MIELRDVLELVVGGALLFGAFVAGLWLITRALGADRRRAR